MFNQVLARPNLAWRGQISRTSGESGLDNYFEIDTAFQIMLPEIFHQLYDG
jgi:hypothetical protein